jgi:hypothetical protein
MKIFWKQCRFKIQNKTQWAMTMAYEEVTGKGVQVSFQECPCATVEMVCDEPTTELTYVLTQPHIC